MQRTIPSADWRELVSRLVKSEMSKRKVRYDELSKRLADHGTVQTADNLRNKVNRGIMGADLLLQIMYVLNLQQIDRELLEEILKDIGHNLN